MNGIGIRIDFADDTSRPSVAMSCNYHKSWPFWTPYHNQNIQLVIFFALFFINSPGNPASSLVAKSIRKPVAPEFMTAPLPF